jgi:hypothetical protein
MKYYSVVVLLYFCCLSGVSAQNWRLLQYEKLPLFGNDTNNILATVSPDSVVVDSNGDSLLYNYRSLNPDCNCSYLWGNTIWYYAPGGRCNYADTGWLGMPVIISGNTYSFVTFLNDTLVLKTDMPLNSSWNFCSGDSGKWIRATVVSESIEPIMGTPDTVRELELTLMLPGNIPGTSLDTIHRVRWSKDHGLIEGFYFYYFDFNKAAAGGYYDMRRHINLLGYQHGGGKKLITNREIYDFQVGDEFHYSGDVYHLAPVEFGIGAVDIYQRKRIVTSKVQTADTVKYSFLDSTYFRAEHLPPAGLPTYTVSKSWGTSTLIKLTNDNYILPNICPVDSFFSSFPSQLRIVDYRHGFYNSGGWGLPLSAVFQKLIREISTTQTFLDSSHTFHYCVFEWARERTFFEVEGLGVVYARDGSTGTMGKSGYEEELIYYKKGNETAGSPLVINSVNEITLPRTALYPNPVKSELSIDIHVPVSGLKLIVRNLLGSVIVIRKYSSQDLLKLDTRSLLPGMYILTLEDSHGLKSTHKFVKE